MNVKLSKGWTTHLAMLIKVVGLTKGPVLELGSGYFSTPVLHWMCAEDRRPLTTYDDSKYFYDAMKQFHSRTHKIRFVKNWDKIKFDKYSVVLVDHSANRRAKDIIRLKDKADYIVIHDTEQDVYKYDDVWKHFKYVKHWKFCKPYTSVVSNFKDVSHL